MMQKNIITILLCSLFACVYPPVWPQEDVHVKGQLINSNYQIITIINLQSGHQENLPVDSNGMFKADLALDKPGFFRFKLNENRHFVFVFEPGEQVTLTLDVTDLHNSKIEGSEQSRYILNTFRELREYELRAEEFQQRMQKEKTEHLKQKMLSNKSELGTMVFLDNFQIKEELELYQKIGTALEQNYPDNKFASDLNRKIKRESFLATGTLAPDITLPTPDGKKKSLSSLRGNVVLIDFWASWCGPCRKENPNVVKLYQKYKNKGFEVFGVSLDRNKESWIKAIETDNLTWTHVSDLKHWKSEVIPLYGVSGIPYMVLINKEGKIIEKGLRGENLENKLKEIFGE